MRILQTISQLGNGGAEKLVVELSNQLNREDDITLLSFRKVQDWMFFPKRLDKDIDLIELDKQKGFNPIFIYKLYKILKNKKPDIVHIHLISTLQYFMFLIPYFKNINFIYTIHNEFHSYDNTFKRLSRFWFFKRIKFVCLAENIESEYKNAFPELNFYTVYNGISKLKDSLYFHKVKEEVEKIRENQYNKIFIFIGRLAEEKNIPLLLDIFSNLENSKLLIIGKDTSEELEFLSYINNNPASNIFYLGAKENIGDYIKSSDALVITSLHEGLPIVALEALSLGVPILSTPVGSLRDLIKNWENGFLSKEIDKESYLKVVKLFLYLNKEEINKIKKKNIELFNKKYSIEICTKNYKKIYINGGL